MNSVCSYKEYIALGKSIETKSKESHKINLINIKSNKENLYKENQKLKNEIHKLDCDTQLQVNEIMRIQQENQTLYEENNKLKIELNKLDNIIYSNNAEHN